MVRPGDPIRSRLELFSESHLIELDVPGMHGGSRPMLLAVAEIDVEADSSVVAVHAMGSTLVLAAAPVALHLVRALDVMESAAGDRERLQAHLFWRFAQECLAFPAQGETDGAHLATQFARQVAALDRDDALLATYAEAFEALASTEVLTFDRDLFHARRRQWLG